MTSESSPESSPSQQAADAERDDARFATLVARERSDVSFVYAVTTTGVYCRPACASRRPLRANTRFFASFAEAERAGFRACRRCRPDAESPHAALLRSMERICRLIDETESAPSLTTLALEAGMSPAHFQRVFRATLGVTPKAYAAARRRAKLQSALALTSTASVTQAAYDSGYNSSSRFYANAATELGMSPGAYRGGAANAAIRYACGTCSLGTVLVAVTERGVCAIDLGDDAATLTTRLHARFPQARLAVDDAEFEGQLAEAIALADGDKSERPTLALDIAGTAFAQRVWAALRAVPYGATATYGEIARRIGAPGSARAVAKACAANSVALAIPCHRIVREDGADTSYRWGAARKRELLRRERGN